MIGPGWENGSEKELLKTIAAEFPGHAVRYVVGYIAVPEDTPDVTASTLSRLLEKLRAERDEEGGNL